MKKSLIELLSHSVGEMFDDLGLGAGLVPRVALSDFKTEIGDFLFELRVGKVSCLGPIDRDWPESDDLKQIARLLENSIFAWRDTLFVPLVRESEWVRLTDDIKKSWITRKVFDDILKLTIRHGLDVPKAMDTIKSLLINGMEKSDLPNQIELVLATHAEEAIHLCAQWSSIGVDAEKFCSDIRRNIFTELGILYPSLKLRSDSRLEYGEFRFRINRLGSPVQGFNGLDLLGSVSSNLKTHAPIFATSSTIDYSLGSIVEVFPMHVLNAIERFGTVKMLQIFRELLDEGVSIRDMRTVISGMLEVVTTLPSCYAGYKIYLPCEGTILLSDCLNEKDVTNRIRADAIRIQLKEQISQSCADSSRKLRTFRTTHELERRLLQLSDKPLSRKEHVGILNSVYSVADKRASGTVLLTSRLVRRSLRELMRYELLDIPVLCDEEISRYVNVEEGDLVIGL